VHRRIVSTLITGALVALLAGPALADQPEDAWITTKVKMSLLTADDINPFAIDVDTIDGVVTLHGRIDSEARKSAAGERAMGIEGVRDVRNLLAVVPAAEEKRVEVADDELRGHVKTVLERDKALAGSDIEVKSVNDGIVVLSGSAETLSAHRRALEDARSVDGVRRVASEIRSPDQLGDQEIWEESVAATATDIRGGASDTWITTKAKVALMSKPGISPFAVNVDTRDAVVTLFGTVNSENAKKIAEQQVKQIDGVKAVENELQVVPDVAAARVEAQDEDIAAAVEARLADRESLRGSEIDVEVSNGVVRLSGTVPSSGDRLTALTVARGTQGVESIVDDLKLDRPRG
jgi:hyperosmotically inducible periplasmic protein